MSRILVEGGQPLRGELTVQSAKNSVLPILAATILAADLCVIEQCPHLSDVETACKILRHLGSKAYWDGDNLIVDTTTLMRCDIPEALMRQMRSSVIFLGAILARCGGAEMSYPGGCELGARPIDLHIAALKTLGAEIQEEGGNLRCRSCHLCGDEIMLSIPSVGATENAMLAACGAEGVTTITNAAREPEIVDLQRFLRKLGVHVSGAGSSAITVRGKKQLHGCKHRCFADRIVAATYLSAVAATGGEVRLKQVEYRHLSTVTMALMQAGCKVCSRDKEIYLKSRGALRAISPIRTSPYPGFPTDAQPLVMAALLKSRGTTVFVENIFENRYRHVPELRRLGANIRLEDRVAILCGVKHLCGAKVRATDLRGGAALIVAGLQCQGQTQIEQVQHIHRGYQSIVTDLQALGANIREL